jgi:hypothetical protein
MKKAAFSFVFGLVAFALGCILVFALAFVMSILSGGEFDVLHAAHASIRPGLLLGITGLLLFFLYAPNSKR